MEFLVVSCEDENYFLDVVVVRIQTKFLPIVTVAFAFCNNFASLVRNYQWKLVIRRVACSISFCTYGIRELASKESTA